MVVAAWNWGAVTNFSFPSSPPPKPQKPLEAKCKPGLLGRAWAVKVKSIVVPDSHPLRPTLSGKPDPVMRDQLSWGPF